MPEVQLTSREQLALRAIDYILTRAQTDSDFRYAMLDTEGWERLVEAEANLRQVETGPLAEARRRDLRPGHRRYKPTVVELREEIAKYSERVMALESEIDDLR